LEAIQVRHGDAAIDRAKNTVEDHLKCLTYSLKHQENLSKITSLINEKSKATTQLSIQGLLKLSNPKVTYFENILEEINLKIESLQSMEAPIRPFQRIAGEIELLEKIIPAKENKYLLVPIDAIFTATVGTISGIYLYMSGETNQESEEY